MHRFRIVYKIPSRRLRLIPMTTLLILLSLCTLICSNSLSHFQDVGIYNDVEVVLSSRTLRDKVVHKFNAAKDEKTPNDSLFNGSPESCAEQCLLTKFFCSSFVVVDPDGEMQCIMSRDEFPLQEYFHDFDKDFPHAQVVGTFKCVSRFDTWGLRYSIKEKIDNVKEISKAPTLLRKDKFNELLQGYGFSESFDKNRWADMRKLLTECLTALDIPKRPVNPTSGSASKYTHSGQPSQMLGNTPESKLLTNLELFILGVNRNAHTVYHRGKRILYIDLPEVQVLIWSPVDNGVVWTVSGEKIFNNYIDRGFAGLSYPKQETWEKLNIFHTKTAQHFGHNVINRSVQVFNGRRSFWSSVCRLTGPWDCESGNQFLLIEDLVKVVSILHDRPQMKYTERLLNSFPSEHVDIITQRK